jgi:hypothetical protein
VLPSLSRLEGARLRATAALGSGTGTGTGTLLPFGQRRRAFRGFRC